MKQCRRLMALAGFLVSSAVHATTGNELLNELRDSDTSQIHAFGYITAIVESDARGRFSCMPPGVTVQQASEAAKAFLEMAVDVHHEQAWGLTVVGCRGLGRAGARAGD